jgi:hypothetical protein
MAIFRRAVRAEVHSTLTLEQGERPIAWARGPSTRDGRDVFVVATDRALHVGPLANPPRIPWDRVVKAMWDEPVLNLVVQARPGEPPRRLPVRLEEPGEVPVVVRERVMASIVIMQHVPLRGEKGVRLVARRGSDDGRVRWSAVFDPGLDPGDPALRAEADRALADLRGHVGA